MSFYFHQKFIEQRPYEVIQEIPLRGISPLAMIGPFYTCFGQKKVVESGENGGDRGMNLDDYSRG